jgi:hypothetical protein
VKLADDAQPVELVLTGRPMLPAQDWYPDSYNLVGFPVGDGSALSFAEYFAPSPAHSGSRVHTLASDGTWQQIGDTGAATIERGRAYWVWCDGPSDYAGPMAVSVGGGDVLAFGSERTSAQVEIGNLERTARAYTVRLLPSAPVPADAGAAGDAGPLLLSYWHAEYEPPKFTWKPLPVQLDYQVEAGELRKLLLSLRRTEMPASPGRQYQGLLEVSDERGLRVLVPMNADGAVVTADSAPLPRDGLWVGGVILDRVSEVNSNSPAQPTPAPLGFRLIVHQDSNGVVRLLSEATEVLATKTSKTQLIILSDGRTLAQYVDPSDQNSIVARYSAVTFGFRGPRTLSYSASTKTLSGTLTLGYDDPLNPFKHLYHPDHNNLDNFRTELAEGVESYTVTRSIAMVFSSTPVKGATTAGWGDTVAGGEYTESVKGLYHDTLATSGTLILKHVSATTILR